MDDRLLQDFLELCVIEGPSRKEGPVAAAVRAKLAELGLKVEEDGSARAVGGEVGNLLAELAPANPKRWVTLASHMDAVPPGCGRDPYIEEGAVRTRGDILAADDRAGIALLLGILRALKAEPLQHTGIQALFTVSEESGVGGADTLQAARVKGEFAVVLDTGGPPGQANNQSPFARRFELRFTGRSAHAGIEPEKGVNALAMAARVVSALPSGRVDADTTFSFTQLEAGTATNVIPERATLKGEVRSYRGEEVARLMGELEACARGVAAEAGGAVELLSELQFPPFHVPEETPWLRRLFDAAQAEGFTPIPKRSGGGSDANSLNAKGVPAVNVGVGYRKGHSPQEHLILAEFEGTYRWVLRFLREFDAGLTAGAEHRP